MTQRCLTLIMTVFGTQHTSLFCTRIKQAQYSMPVPHIEHRYRKQRSLGPKRCVGTRHRHGHESHCVLNRARQLTSRPRDPYFSGKFRRSCARQYADAPAKPELRRSTGHPRCQLHLRPKRPAKTALSASTMRALGQILVLPALRERWLISQTHKQGLRSAGWRDGIYAYLPSRSR